MEDVRYYQEQTEVLTSLNTADRSCFAYSSQTPENIHQLCNPFQPSQEFGCLRASEL